MLIEVKVPVLPESVAEATLVNWHKKAGQAVARDENLVDVETDKVVLELPAPGDGVLAEIRRADGSIVTAQEVIAVIDTDGKPEGAAVPAARPAAAAPVAAPKASGAAGPSPAPSAAAPGRVAPDGGADALPAARKLMAESGLRPEGVAGTGRGGRVTKGDVLAATAPRASAPPGAVQARGPQPAPTPPQTPPVAPPVQLPANLSARPEQRVPMSRLRQGVAERLVQSQSTAAILTTFNEVNMAAVIELRNRYKERFEREHGVKLGFMGFFVKAVVQALK
ncbi:MAG: biotin/lipoyl-containing protein, partial [Acidobacteriota bacterium]